MHGYNLLVLGGIFILFELLAPNCPSFPLCNGFSCVITHPESVCVLFSIPTKEPESFRGRGDMIIYKLSLFLGPCITNKTK